MQPQTPPLCRPDDPHKKEIERLKAALAVETRVLAVLVASGIVTEKKLAQIRAIASRM